MFGSFVNEISPKEYEELKKNEDIFLIDVREEHELEVCKTKEAKHIKMGDIPARINEIPKDKKVVVMCHHGARSKRVCEYLLANGFENDKIFNFYGGINAYACDIDPKIGFY